MTIDVGKMRDRISIYRNVPIQDAIGSRPEKLTLVATVWGSVDTDLEQSQETTRDSQERGVAVNRLTMRYYPGLTTAHFLKWTDTQGTVHTLGILSLRDIDNRHSVFEVKTKEVT